MPTLPRDASRPLLAVGIAALAVMGFALGDVLTKTLAGRYPVIWLMLARYGLNLLILLAVLGPRHGRALWRTERTGLVCLRAASLAFGSLAMAFALRVLPVGEAVAILYISPVVVILLARPVLGEPLTATGLACALAGFCGVLAIVRPGTGLVLEGVIFALINVGLAAVYHLTTRLLSRTETAAAMQVNSAAIGTAIFLPLALAGPPGARAARARASACPGRRLARPSAARAPAARLRGIGAGHRGTRGALQGRARSRSCRSRRGA
ncbi:DMT family transporter [Mangrovicoccus ximenensis]|uniref:DMT family transporter n=1 Tax=Mangrovicoccus ximenensis TaxID=1911570 RepID=UPI000D3C476B|nr:DMT family transporter [Mangrovicoccus ximenensis]